MKKKFLLFLVVLLLLFTVPVFAERSGSIVGTFGSGFSSFFEDDEANTLTSIAFDLELISDLGISVLFGNKFNFRIGDGINNIPYFGFGYRFMAEIWSFGLSIICVPLEFANDALIGMKISGSYWLTRSLGLTLSFMYGFGVDDDISAINVRIGGSVRIW